MERGLYELLITQDVDAHLSTSAEAEIITRQVDAADEPHVMARHVEAALRRVLTSTRDSGSAESADVRPGSL